MRVPVRYALHAYELEARGAEFPWAHIEAVPRGGAVSLFHVCTDSLQRPGLLAHVGVRAERVVIPAREGGDSRREGGDCPCFTKTKLRI